MDRRTRPSRAAIGVAAAIVLVGADHGRVEAAETRAPWPAAPACAGDNAGIVLPSGFCATVFADQLGHARHLVVAPDGVVYVNDWSGRYYKSGQSPASGPLVALRDTDGDGKADVDRRFGPAESAGGTGIAIYKGWLFAEADDRIDRYRLPASGQGIVPQGEPETVVSGLPLTGDHPMHPFAIDPQGQLYVDLGSATNSCQAENRMPGSPGHQPCTELLTRGGIWRYDANRTGQVFSPAERFVTGLRNGEGLSFDASGRLYGTQHGRDQLAENWGEFYTARQGAELPAEELVLLHQGADFGWPECYFDPQQGKLVLAPEYGGDGGKKTGVCADKQPPVAAFPAHWAPNDLLIYRGNAFPTAYRGGAFIAFHGSWNRAPAPQGGYAVVFQPLADGKAVGDWVVFADGFAGGVKEPGRAAHRPSGLAAGPDGALYIGDDQNGRIWRVTYQGDPKAPIQAAPSAGQEAASSGRVPPPEGIHADAGAQAALPTPPGVKPAQVALGGRIFRGEAKGGTCGGCHGSDGKGTPNGPDLTTGTWRWGDGSLASIARTITTGVARPKAFTGAMPPRGGVDLSKADVNAVAAYVWALGHPKG